MLHCGLLSNCLATKHNQAMLTKANLVPAAISRDKFLKTMAFGREGYANLMSSNVMTPFTTGSYNPSVELASIRGFLLMTLSTLRAARPGLPASGKRIYAYGVGVQGTNLLRGLIV